MGNNADIIALVYELANRREMAPMLALIDAKFTIWQTEELPWGGDYQGHEGFAGFYGKLAAHVNSAVTVDEIFEAGDQVVAIGRTRGTVVANGAPFDLRFVHVWKVQGGKVMGFIAYIDTPGMLAVLKE